jgi:hypothetical protein
MTPVWKSRTISENTKLRLYTSIVIPTAVYACETWKRTKKISHRLNVFHRRCLRTILGISWREHISNEEVLGMAGSEDLEITVERRRRRMGGHILRRPMPANRPAKRVMTWRPESGRRSRGRPKKTWRSTFSEDLTAMGISWDKAEEAAGGRKGWQDLVDQCSEKK